MSRERGLSECACLCARRGRRVTMSVDRLSLGLFSGLPVVLWSAVAAAADGGTDWGEDTSLCSSEDRALCNSVCEDATCGDGRCTSPAACTGYCPIAGPTVYCSCTLPCTTCRPGTDLCRWICERVRTEGPASVEGICMPDGAGNDITAERCDCGADPGDAGGADGGDVAGDSGGGDAGVGDEIADAEVPLDVSDGAADGSGSDGGDAGDLPGGGADGGCHLAPGHAPGSLVAIGLLAVGVGTWLGLARRRRR